jgi:hypothetical protein
MPVPCGDDFFLIEDHAVRRDVQINCADCLQRLNFFLLLHPASEEEDW